MTIAYRILENNKGQPHTLFHGLNGSRKLPLNKWLKAEERLVRNPGKSTGTKYVSGFHVLLDKKELLNYLKRFKNLNNRHICKVYIRNYRSKPNSKVYLAGQMMIKTMDWKDSIYGIKYI